MIRWTLLPLLLVSLLAGSAVAKETIRLVPLGENPPQPKETGSRTWARLHQLGGIDGTRAFIFLPVAVEYVRLLALEDAIPEAELPRLGPWTDAFWVHFNVYQYTPDQPEAPPVDVSREFASAKFTLRWGDPTTGDSAVIPEPQQRLAADPAVVHPAGLWVRLVFPDVATAADFRESPLQQLRLEQGEREYVFDLEPWADLHLFADAAPVPLVQPVGPQPVP